MHGLGQKAVLCSAAIFPPPPGQCMQLEKLEFVIPHELGGTRLDRALALLCPQHSRARLQSWIRCGRITVNSRTLRQRDPVQGGEIVVIDGCDEDAPHAAAGEPIPLEVIHEDRSILIINKPAGLVVHPGAGNPRRTLMNALLHFAPELERVPRAGIVQRLDKDTSGVIMIARTPEAHTYLVGQLKARKVKREYLALVGGVLTAGGSVDAPIGRHTVERKRMAVKTTGKAAVTHYRILKRYPAHTLLRLRLETGRTHQIRVHMAHIHHPVVGDPVYGGRRRLPKGASVELREALRTFPRQALHASDLSLVHPDSGRPAQWTAPLPADMRTLLALMENES